MRNLTTLVVCGVLGSVVMVGNAEACHKKSCGHTPVVCATPAPAPVVYEPCAPKVKKHCFKLPSFCHKKPVCAPVYYGAPVTYAAPMATPQASMQH